MARRKGPDGISAARWFAGQSFHGNLPVRGEAVATSRTSPDRGSHARSPDTSEHWTCEFCRIAQRIDDTDG